MSSADNRSRGTQERVTNKLSRRLVLRGLGGVTLGLPLLEGLAPRHARAQDLGPLPYAIFFRQGNGVATAQENEEIGTEPERFWPREFGALDATNVEGRALEELLAYASQLLCVKNVNMEDFDYGDGHARGALQLLTARKPVVSAAGGDSEADGESVDHRIGRQLNPAGQDSLFLYAGTPGGWLGGPCISYRGSNNRRSALHNPWDAYQSLIGGAAGLTEEALAQLVVRNKSVNDLVSGQLTALLGSKSLSARDRERLDLHLSSVRDLETSLACRLDTAQTQSLQQFGEVPNGEPKIYESEDGEDVWTTVRWHMDITAIAIACGITRSAAIQVGNGNDGSTRYQDPDTGEQMENYHYISHRRFSHDATGGVIANSDLLHSKIDRQFAQAFSYLLDRLSAYNIGDVNLLDAGVSVWLNDLGNGPGHSSRSIPMVIAGSAGGYFKQGQYIELDDGDWEVENHARLINTIATAVGCTSEGKDICDDIGDPDLDHSPHPALMA